MHLDLRLDINDIFRSSLKNDVKKTIKANISIYKKITKIEIVKSTLELQYILLPLSYSHDIVFFSDSGILCEELILS